MGLFSVFVKSSSIYFPGCVTFFKHREHFELYRQIFSKLGIDFRILEKKICCGLPAIESGYENEARKLARRNFEIFKEENVKSIITNSPCCYKMFQDYPKIIPDWNIEVKNIWKIILNNLEEKPGLIKNKRDSAVVYQDSCYLGRHCGIYEEPRKILEIIGYDVKEFLDKKENSFCCGSCGNLVITNPQLADKIAREKILQAKRMGVKRIVVSSIEDYSLLKKNSDRMVSVLELSEILADALGITDILDAQEKESEVENIISESEDISELMKKFSEVSKEEIVQKFVEGSRRGEV